MTFQVTSTDDRALGGKATRKEASVYFTGKEDGSSMSILVYLPNDAPKPIPAFIGLKFYGNRSIHPDPEITLSTRWMRDRGKDIVKNRATEESHGASASRWPVARILERGCALATVYCGDLDPDFHDGFQNGVHPLFYRRRARLSWRRTSGEPSPPGLGD